MSDQCTNVVFDKERGEIICVDTGEVLSEHWIELSPDWRAYNGEEWLRRAHVGALTHTVHDSGLITEIDLTIKNYRDKLKYAKLRQLQRKIRIDKDEKRLVEALAYMNQLCAILGLPDHVKETAGIIIKHMFGSLTFRHSKLKVYVIAAIVYAAKIHGIPIRAKELLPKFGISEDEYWKALSDLNFRAKIPNIKAYLDPRAFLPSIVSNLGLSQRVYLLASMIIDVMKRRGYTEGKDPAGIAAAAIYVASIITNEKRTQKHVAKAAGVTEVTIRNRYRDIVDKLCIEVDI